MTPVRNLNHPAERRYNLSHARTRGIVERLFGVWKGRFPCLSLGLRNKVDNCFAIIVAVAVLHNIAIMYQEEALEEDERVGMEEDVQDVYDGEDDRLGNVVRRALIRNHFQ